MARTPDHITVDLSVLPPDLALQLGALTAELIAEAEARGYQRAIDALRAAIYSLSEADDMHNGEDFGPDKCLGCRWRLRLADEVKRVEASAQTAIRSGESTDE